MASVSFARVGKAFAGHHAVSDVSLQVGEGEFVALLGPSGCGKTTLLRMIAGFEYPDRGEIRIGDELVGAPGFSVPPERRNIGMVFQSYALWPHMSVAGNVGFALKLKHVPRPERHRRVAEMLELVGLGHLGARRPHELSGGQRQRVALARALAARPGVLLLDEPLANLDAHLREAMQREFHRLHRQVATTFIYVTHDQSEAMALADRIAVMEAGVVRQVARPQTLYREPTSASVARFIGRGMVVPVRVTAPAPRPGSVMVDLFGTPLCVRGTAPIGATRGVVLRAEHLTVVAADAPGTIGCRVTDLSFGGATTLVTLMPEGPAGDTTELRAVASGELPEIGQLVGLRIDDGWLLPEDGDTI
ncbi:iron(III) transport system ATP-binding protein [Faunimonas pinastri]|uniref:Iron(III) transport system ATP-binding protein n=1 Tax=Faunimonas pinastri TaxID=1855383 RepID=A0A1H9AB74_9HYPH|nr:iron(III) transport system ATP-binding protein [Faunimonas pinastri]